MQDLEAIIEQKAEEYTPKVLSIAGRQGYRQTYIDAFKEEIRYVMETRSVARVEDLTSEHWRSIKILGHGTAMKRIEALTKEKREREEALERERAAREANKLKVGECFSIEVNQGLRDAIVLAVIGDEALIEYSMPKGSTSLRIVDAYTWTGARSVSYRNVPVKWLQQMYENEVEWEGCVQGTVKVRNGVKHVTGGWAKSVKETYEALSSRSESTSDQPRLL
jgi:hypothetical protein